MQKRLVLLLTPLVLWAAWYFMFKDEQILDIAPKIAEQQTAMLLLKGADGKAVPIDLEAAVVGYVAAEIGPNAPTEALKAQAVAVRSFAYAEQQAAGCVCGLSTHCMAYLDAAARAERWGSAFAEYEEKLTAAVAATAGELLWADDVVQKAYFSAVCGGRTETVNNLWGGENKWPATDCYWEGADSGALGAVFYSKTDLAARLGVAEADLPLLKISAENDGRLSRVSLGRKSWRGADFRALLGLRSTRVSWLAGAEGVWFTTVGYGHGVGLCQAGAVGMANVGYNYRQILAHYYPGLSLHQ